MNNVKVVKIPKFMHNKRCPECDSDAFVIEQKDGQRFWYCAKCERKLLREIIIKKEKKWNEGFIQVLRLLRGWP